MKFHVAVVQCNGQVTDRGERTGARVRSSDVGRRLATAFDLMLEEQLPKVVAGPVKETLPLFDDRRGPRCISRFGNGHPSAPIAPRPAWRGGLADMARCRRNR